MQVGIIIQVNDGHLEMLPSFTENWQSLIHHGTNAMNVPLMSFGFTTSLHRVLLPNPIPENLGLRAFFDLKTLFCCPGSSLEVLQNQ